MVMFMEFEVKKTTRRRVNMKLSKRIVALTAALTICMTLVSCSAKKEDNGVAYEKEMKISTAADLEGKAVAVQLRSADDDYIVTNKLTKYPKRYSDMTKAVQDLVDKKVAAVVVDSYYAKQLTDGVEGVEIIKKSIGSVEYRFLFNKSDAKLVENINKQIAALKESDEYQSMTESELVSGKSYRISKESDKELKKTFNLVTEPSFKPFTYKKKDEVKGLFASISDGVVYGCGGKLNITTVEPVEIDDTSSANTDEITSFDGNEAQTIKGKKNAFCVVSSAAKEDDTVFVTTDSFYTSELVMIVRAEEEEKK